MPTIDYLPFATGGGSNVDTQGNYVGSGYQTAGFTAGLAQSKQSNKVWRQCSIVAAALANFISNMLGGIDVLDDGNLAALVVLLTKAVRQGANGLVVVAFSATPQFDAAVANKFQITLTGNTTLPTLVNLLPGQTLTVIVKQDPTGGRVWVNPVNLPMSAVDTTANAVNIQKFEVDSAGNVYQATPLAVS